MGADVGVGMDVGVEAWSGTGGRGVDGGREDGGSVEDFIVAGELAGMGECDWLPFDMDGLADGPWLLVLAERRLLYCVTVLYTVPGEVLMGKVA